MDTFIKNGHPEELPAEGEAWSEWPYPDEVTPEDDVLRNMHKRERQTLTEMLAEMNKNDEGWIPEEDLYP